VWYILLNVPVIIRLLGESCRGRQMWYIYYRIVPVIIRMHLLSESCHVRQIQNKTLRLPRYFNQHTMTPKRGLKGGSRRPKHTMAHLDPTPRYTTFHNRATAA